MSDKTELAGLPVADLVELRQPHQHLRAALAVLELRLMAVQAVLVHLVQQLLKDMELAAVAVLAALTV